MIILIAEAKTMAPCREAVSAENYRAHCAGTERQADAIMASLRAMPQSELAAASHLSNSLAAKLREMILDFHDKSRGARAIEAFTGVVFKALDYTTLPLDARSEANATVRIISSLYGLLRPDDIIKPYRLDFNMALAPEGKTFAAYWREMVTDSLLKELRANGCQDILNLLPGEAERSVNWHRISSEARVWKAEFRQILPGGTVRTPNANRLKTLRGKLLRQLLTERPSRPETLSSIESPDYFAAEVTPDHSIIFHTA